MKIVFIADFFAPPSIGGAEFSDQGLIELLSSNVHIVQTSSEQFNAEYLSAKYANSVFLISNRTRMSTDVKEYLRKNCQYALLEHDHQYLLTRDPSPYLDFRAPSHLVKDKEFYETAFAVFCPSSLHKRCIEANIPKAHVVSLGTSFWCKEHMDVLRALAQKTTGKSGKVAVVDWVNPIKGKQDSLNWCTASNNTPVLIPHAPFPEFMQELWKHSILAFHPRTIETFSRIIAEAKMLGLGIATTPAKVGIFSEDGYKERRGIELIDFIEEKQQEAAKTIICECLNRNKKRETTGDITCVLNVYRRPHLLREQIEACINQTIAPKDVFVWINQHEDNEDFDFSWIPKNMKVFRCNHNWKYHGRYIGALLAETKFISLLDDDTIPGPRWHENCLSTMKQVGENSILGSAGVILNDSDYRNHQRAGWPRPSTDIVEVDLVGHSSFFTKETLLLFLKESMLTTETGEDIHFSYVAQKYGNVKTYAPSHPPNDRSFWGSLKAVEYGVDNVASSNPVNHERFYKIRDEMVKHYMENGWKTIKKKNEI